MLVTQTFVPEVLCNTQGMVPRTWPVSKEHTEEGEDVLCHVYVEKVKIEASLHYSSHHGYRIHRVRRHVPRRGQ